MVNFYTFQNQIPVNLDVLTVIALLLRNKTDLLNFIHTCKQTYQLKNVAQVKNAIKKENNDWFLVRHNKDNMYIIVDPSPALQMYAIDANPKYIGDLITGKLKGTIDNIVAAIWISQNPDSFKYAHKNIRKNRAVQKVAVSCNSSNIQYIDEPSEKIQMLAVSKSDYAMQYIKKPCRKAIKYCADKRPYSLFDMKDVIDDSIVAPYLKKDGRLLQLMKNPTKENILDAISQSGYSIEYVKNPEKDIQLAAVKKAPKSIAQIENPCIEAQFYVVQKNRNNFKSIKNPTIREESTFVTLDGIDLEKQALKRRIEELEAEVEDKRLELKKKKNKN